MSEILYWLVARWTMNTDTPEYMRFDASGALVPTTKPSIAMRYHDMDTAIMAADRMGLGWFATQIAFRGDAMVGS
jgi:hypothetical protein